MRLDVDQLASLDALDWFPDGSEAAWDDDALRVFATIPDYALGDKAEQWVKYVHLISLTNPELTPSENFCRRVAMVFDGQLPFEEVTEEAASTLSKAEIVRLFRLRFLARVDSLDLDNKTAYEIIKNFSQESNRNSVSLISRLNAFFYHREINPLHIEFLVAELRSRGSFDLEMLMFLAAHPLSSRDVLRVVAKVSIPQMDALYANGDTYAAMGSRGTGDEFIAFSYISNHLKASPHLSWMTKRKLRDFVGADNSSSWVNYYIGEDVIVDLATKYSPKFWWAHFNDPQPNRYRLALPADLSATVHGVGGEGVPPGVALFAATQFLVGIERDELQYQEQMRFWAVPYMRATRRWVTEMSGADNVPFEWLVSLLGYDENSTEAEWDLLPTSVKELWAKKAEEALVSSNP